mgnify:CR=1 FL=1|tara:strand:- start:516 stop:986 length:471 start_codon:yes stop_codon:yes gene_type:complete
MLVICNNCNKKFSIDDQLIPDSGRLLQCGSCDHKWFFKKEIVKNEIDDVRKISINKNKEKNISRQKKHTPKKVNDNKIEDSSETPEQTDMDYDKKIKKVNFFKIFLVIIISLISIILILDTFKEPLTIIFPNIKTLLTNLYLSINDANLFFKDLIK